jgi:hypothetical protein
MWHEMATAPKFQIPNSKHQAPIPRPEVWDWRIKKRGPSQLRFGERARPGRRSARLAPNASGVERPERRDDFMPQNEPRGGARDFPLKLSANFPLFIPLPFIPLPFRSAPNQLTPISRPICCPLFNSISFTINHFLRKQVMVRRKVVIDFSDEGRYWPGNMSTVSGVYETRLAMDAVLNRKEFDPYGEWVPVRDNECRALAGIHKAAKRKGVRFNVFDFPDGEIMCAADNQQSILRLTGSAQRFFEVLFE